MRPRRVGAQVGGVNPPARTAPARLSPVSAARRHGARSVAAAAVIAANGRRQARPPKDVVYGVGSATARPPVAKRPLGAHVWTLATLFLVAWRHVAPRRPQWWLPSLRLQPSTVSPTGRPREGGPHATGAAAADVGVATHPRKRVSADVSEPPDLFWSTRA